MGTLKSKLLAGLLLLMVLATSAAMAEPSSEMMDAVKDLQHRWEVIKYNMAKDKQEDAFAALAKDARRVSEQYSEKAEPLVWEGIILSTYAGAKGGLGALSIVKTARERLQQAAEIDPDVLDGSIYTSLGSLYYQVPGWPIGFGNDDKARKYLEKAIQINPNGIDANYFYGDFLYEEGEYEQALQVLNKALQAPARQGRELADNGRRKEIAAKIADVKRML
ncbi:MAG: tetratricopeptide repeat protein [Gammaproteobacteria bacterium]